MHIARMIRAAILGASGYVGGELMRLIAGHPAMEVGVAFGASNAGQKVSAIQPGAVGVQATAPVAGSTVMPSGPDRSDHASGAAPQAAGW